MEEPKLHVSVLIMNILDYLNSINQKGEINEGGVNSAFYLKI